MVLARNRGGPRRGDRDGDGGGALSAMQLMPSLVSWLDPGAGGLTVATFAQPSQDFGTGWAAFQTDTPVSGKTDPLGGSSAYEFLELATTNYHCRYLSRSAADMSSGPTTFSCWVKAVGGRNIGLIDMADTVPNCVIDGATGAVVTAPAAPATLAVDTTYASAGWFKLTLSSISQLNPSIATIAPAAMSGSSISYAGDVTKGLQAYAPAFVQHRASKLVDRSSSAYEWVQATVGNQPYVQLADGSSPGGNTFTGKAALYQPNDSVRYLSCATAALLTKLNAANTLVVQLKMMAYPALSLQMLGVAGTEPYNYGVDTAGKPYIYTGTSTLTAPDALGTTASRTVAYGFDPATGAATIWVDGVLVAGPTALETRAVAATLATVNVKCCALRRHGLSGVAMNTSQVLAEHQAMVAS